MVNSVAPRHSFLGLLLAVLFLTSACVAPAAQRGGLLQPASHQINLVADGTTQVIKTQATTVDQLLDEANVQLDKDDRVVPSEVTILRDDLTVTVIRVSYTTYTMTQTLPFERQVVRDATVPEGESRLLQSGHTGTLERRYQITFEDHSEVARTLMEEVILEPAQDEIVLIGTKRQLQNIELPGTLAYLSHQDAWIIRDSTFQRRRLTHLGDLDGRVFAISPDGDRLIFTRSVTETEHLNELWTISTVEASPNPTPLNVRDVLWADWSPEGTTIAWTTAEATEQAPGWRGHNDLWSAHLTESAVLSTRRQIWESEGGGGHGWWGTRFAWSPDGERLAYSQPETVGVIDLGTRERAELVTFPALRTYSSWAWNPAVAWAPGADFLTTVVHASIEGDDAPEESPVFNLVTLEAGGTYSATLAVEVGTWAAPQYAPDGTTLLFGRAIIPYQSATSRYTLHLVDRDGSNQRRLYQPAGGGGLEIPVWAWSPDGNAVVFIENEELHLLALDAAAPETLTDEGGVTHFDWH